MKYSINKQMPTKMKMTSNGELVIFNLNNKGVMVNDYILKPTDIFLRNHYIIYIQRLLAYRKHKINEVDVRYEDVIENE